MYKAYLFDWDGCLADTLAIWLHTHEQIFSHFGIPFPEHRDFEQVLADLNFEKGVQARDPKYVAEMYAKCDREISQHADLNPGAAELIKDLKAKGKKIAIVTSSPRQQVETMLKRQQLLDDCNVLVCAEDTTKHKPHPEPLIKALEILQVDKSDAVMIGDTYYDINAAKALGMDCVLYHSPMHDKFYDLTEEVKQNPPTHVVANLVDILKL